MTVRRGHILLDRTAVVVMTSFLLLAISIPIAGFVRASSVRRAAAVTWYLTTTAKSITTETSPAYKLNLSVSANSSAYAHTPSSVSITLAMTRAPFESHTWTFNEDK